MTNCRTVRSWIFRELERELPVDEALELDRHVASCAECGKLWARAQRLEDALLALAEPPVEHVDVERNLRAIEKRIAALEAPRASRRRRWIASLLISAGALAAAIVWIVTTSGAEVREPAGEVRVATPSEATPAIRDVPEPEPAGAAPSTNDELANTEALPESDGEPRFDRQRYDAVREALRGELVRAPLPELALAEPVRELAERVDGRARELELAGWPLHRLAASLFDDPDPSVARAAIRYVGLRGDRLASLELERRAATNAEALFALVDAKPEASAALAAACSSETLGALVRQRLETWPASERAKLFEAALRRAGGAERERNATLEALARCGGESVEAIVKLAQSRALELEPASSALASMPDSPRLLVELATRSRDHYERDLLVDLAARLHSKETLEWLDALARDPRARPSAVRGLVAYATAESLDRMLGLATQGWVGPGDLESALKLWTRSSPEASSEIAELTLAHGERVRTAKLLDALVAVDDRSSVPALARIAASRAVEVEDREIALRAAGDLGTSEDAALLIGVFRGLDLRERRLAAVCIETLMRLGGEAAVERALAGAPRRHTERVLDVLARPSPGSVSLVQLARALEPVLLDDSTIGDQP